jgi:hypothetical protein
MSTTLCLHDKYSLSNCSSLPLIGAIYAAFAHCSILVMRAATQLTHIKLSGRLRLASNPQVRSTHLDLSSVSELLAGYVSSATITMASSLAPCHQTG